MRISAHALTFCVVSRREQYSPSSLQAKAAKMVEHCLPGWETARQVAPRTARTEHIKDRVENAAEGMTSCSTIALGSTQILLQALPLGIREVAWIGRIHAEHCNLSCCCLAYQTRSCILRIPTDRYTVTDACGRAWSEVSLDTLWSAGARCSDEAPRSSPGCSKAGRYRRPRQRRRAWMDKSGDVHFSALTRVGVGSKQ
jgi:hypothetical protein